MSVDNAQPDNLSIDANSKKKTAPRPSMAIYKPPGLRNPGSVSSPTTQSASPTSSSTGNPFKEKSNGKEKSASEESSSPQENSRTSSTPDKSNRSNNYQKSSQDYPRNNQPQKLAKSTEPKPVSITRTLSTVLKDTKKRPLIQKDFDDVMTTFKKLNISKERQLIDEFMASNMESEAMAKSLGQYLVQYAIEENKTNGRTVARLCATLLECPSGVSFHQGLLTSILQYYDCRDQLRVDHLRVWIGFLSFVSDLYAHVGFTYEGEMVEVIFNIFDYMLKQPVLDTLKIEELECMIASLLSVGYDLERQCPDDLGKLKNQIRDAFVEVSEPWARKMILLLMELSASGWTLPAESNDYYFG